MRISVLKADPLALENYKKLKDAHLDIQVFVNGKLTLDVLVADEEEGYVIKHSRHPQTGRIEHTDGGGYKCIRVKGTVKIIPKAPIPVNITRQQRRKAKRDGVSQEKKE